MNVKSWVGFFSTSCGSCMLVVSSLACSANPASVEDTGIRGQVLRGPVTPGPQGVGSAVEKPFSALFHVLDGDDVEVVRFASDNEGRFEVALAPGEYTVVPDDSAPILNPSHQRRDVEVPQDRFAFVTLRFDTGIR
jgi:hypothetical protein